METIRRCDDCDKPAIYVLLLPGCQHCGGGDCGSLPDEEFYCSEDLIKNGYNTETPNVKLLSDWDN